MGVAPLADLHISYFTKRIQTYYADHWANATDSARTDGAVALNMSWGSNQFLQMIYKIICQIIVLMLHMQLHII